MSLTFNAKSYECEYVEVGAEDGQVVVTFVGNFPSEDSVTVEEASNIVNSPLFLDLLRKSYEHAPFGTPLWSAFDRIQRHGGEALLRFQQSENEVAA